MILTGLGPSEAQFLVLQSILIEAIQMSFLQFRVETSTL